MNRGQADSRCSRGTVAVFIFVALGSHSAEGARWLADPRWAHAKRFPRCPCMSQMPSRFIAA